SMYLRFRTFRCLTKRKMRSINAGAAAHPEELLICRFSLRRHKKALWPRQVRNKKSPSSFHHDDKAKRRTSDHDALMSRGCRGGNRRSPAGLIRESIFCAKKMRCRRWDWSALANLRQQKAWAKAESRLRRNSTASEAFVDTTPMPPPSP